MEIARFCLKCVQTGLLPTILMGEQPFLNQTHDSTKHYQRSKELLGTTHHFAIGFGAFCTNFASITGTVCALDGVYPPKARFSAPAVGSKLFFSSFFTCKSAYSCVKITVMCTVPGPQLCYFAFSHRAQGKLGLRFSALSKAVVIFKFCTRLGPTETKKMQCASARSNVSIPICEGADVPGPESLNASVSRSTF